MNVLDTICKFLNIPLDLLEKQDIYLVGKMFEAVALEDFNSLHLLGYEVKGRFV